MFTLRPGAEKDGRDDGVRTEWALRLWHSAGPAAGSLVETYLKSRGISVAPPESIRFHPAIKHPRGRKWPAMLALVVGGEDGVPLAIHRTYLSPDGRTKAPIEPQKMMLGPCHGGAVRLGESGGQLVVGEGIETCLAVMQATGLPVWAALSTSGMQSLRLPPGVEDVVIAADADEAGEAAAQQSAARWAREGWRVSIARPPEGEDFNDMLLAQVKGNVEGTA